MSFNKGNHSDDEYDFNATTKVGSMPSMSQPSYRVKDLDKDAYNRLIKSQIQQPQHLFPETATRTRSWGERLCYGTGISYIVGNTVGGAWGLFEGLKASQRFNSNKLRLNTVLNTVTRRGPFVGNSLGVLALMYNGVNGAVIKLRDGEEDVFNQVGSAMFTGALFKITAGPRPALLAAGFGGFLAGSVAAATYYWTNRNSDSSS